MYTKSPHPSVPVPLPLSLALPVSAPIPNFSQNTKPVATRKGQSAKANNVSPKNHSDGQNKSGKISEGGSTDNATVDKDGENGVVSGTSPFLSSGSEGVSLEDCVGKIKEMCMDQTRYSDFFGSPSPISTFSSHTVADTSKNFLKRMNKIL